MAKRLGLIVVKPYLEESKSAKRPNNRPIFTQMLADLKKGKYHGILSWHPDRLARNMLEGGQLIDMIDEGIIKDLKFVTHHFTSDANGKMLLGMAFVLSKQYSDKLSQDVTRGVRKRFAEGKTPAPKHGYVRDDEGLYRPDGKNFDLICQAWGMKRQGESLETISDYMNKNGYGRVVKRDGRIIKMSPQTLTDVFRDPIYYGILVQAKQTVDLRSIYDFAPATTEEAYNQVQELSRSQLKPLVTKRRLAFYPLKKMIQCAFCGGNRYVGPSTSESSGRLLYYRCDNEACILNLPENRNKRKNNPTKLHTSTRAKVVFDFIYQYLEKNFTFTEADYQEYYKSMTAVADEQREKIKIKIHSGEASLKIIEREIRDRALALVMPNLSETVRKINEKRIEELELKKEQLIQELAEFRAKLTDPEKDKLTLEQFLNLSKRAATIVKAADAVGKDQICRQIFLNLTVDEVKVTSYQLKEPFATLLSTRLL